jgi:hypothetical protein
MENEGLGNPSLPHLAPLSAARRQPAATPTSAAAQGAHDEITIFGERPGYRL